MTGRPDEAQRLTLHRDYPDPIEEVWSAFTESERLGRWFGTYTGHGRPGGTVELTITGEEEAGGEAGTPTTVTVVECDAPRRLVVDIPEGTARTWRVAVDLTESGTGTALVFAQDVVDGLNLADVEAGWRWYLDRLGATLHGGPMPDWTTYAPAH